MAKKLSQNRRPGLEHEMEPKPEFKRNKSEKLFKLENKIAVITGGDSGIGRAVAIAFAQEGADVAFLYLNEHKDAEDTKKLIENENRKCLPLACDVGNEKEVKRAIEKIIKKFGHIDILVNNAAEQHPQESIANISEQQLERTFRTNIFSYFFMTKAALPFMGKGSAIINTSSVTAYKGNPYLLDYSSTKGAIVAFTRSLAAHLAEKEIRVNGVAPGPIWTPLIPSTFSPEKVEKFGQKTLMKRAGEPSEVAPCYVFLASRDSSYMTGQFLHPNGGEIVNG